jgi:hypothetical protein
MSNYRDFVEGLAPIWGSGHWGSRLLGMLWGATSDTVAIGLSSAIVAPWFHREGKQPVDALPLLGEERNMPRYPIETHQQYRSRLWGAWEAWEYAGSAASIEGQFAAAGLVGAKVYEPLRTHAVTGNTHGDWVRAPIGYWSHFWMFLPEGSHSFPSGAHTFGAAGLVFGGTETFGTLLTTADVALLRGIANKWRPAHVICREIIIEFEGPTFGTGHTFGEAGLVFSGTENVALGGGS